MSQLEIYPLSEKPEHLEACASWSHGEWVSIASNPDFEKKLSNSVTFYTESANADTFPQTYVATINNIPVGMASLKETEHPDRKDLKPWLGGVYVHSNYRNQGIAQKLSNKVAEVAKTQLQSNMLYLQTHIPELYKKMEWKEIGTVSDVLGVYNKDNILMERKL